jgi:hypothetical protein
MGFSPVSPSHKRPRHIPKISMAQRVAALEKAYKTYLHLDNEVAEM